MKYKHTNTGKTATVLYSEGIGYELKVGQSVTLNEQLNYSHIAVEQIQEKRSRRSNKEED